MSFFRSFKLAAAALAVALAVPAHAGSLQVSPIRVDLSPEQPAAVMKLQNRGSEPITAQVRVFGWSQTLDEDRLDEARGIVASPPIISIPAGGEQTVRILRTSREAPGGEETYRLLVDEIPQAETARTTGVRMQLRYSVPVFASATSGPATPKVDFTLERASAGADPKAAPARLMLRATNADALHAQLSQVRIEWPDGRVTEMAPGLLGYALAHATRQWPVADAASTATTATVHATINGTPVSTQISLASPLVVSSAK
ncbi:fimbria/pilus periplasmic chaperone [Caballeronia sp. GAWG2-1]|uniref:fimbrial biogenesis chaperone n=1 Tax=Caballeronia sp. GAWG2-1 TaxID=2921744 RepID=UPI0020290E9A|nr:fimbria/pilus periplasmic chaperone [Caballeronia sp. GAWG2-1]